MQNICRIFEKGILTADRIFETDLYSIYTKLLSAWKHVQTACSVQTHRDISIAVIMWNYWKFLNSLGCHHTRAVANNIYVHNIYNENLTYCYLLQESESWNKKIFDKNEKNITREDDQNSERPGRMTEDGDSLHGCLHKSSQLRFGMAMYIDILPVRT